MSDEPSNAPENTEPPSQTEPPKPATDWKAHARTWENRAKESNNKLAAAESTIADLQAKLDAAGSEVATAVDTAKTELVKKHTATVARMLVDAREGDADALLKGRDLSEFIKDGEPNTAALTEWLDKVAPKRSSTDYGGGARGDQGRSSGDKYANDPLAQALRGLSE